MPLANLSVRSVKYRGPDGVAGRWGVATKNGEWGMIGRVNGAQNDG
jgi:hypothetical protein